MIKEQMTLGQLRRFLLTARGRYKKSMINKLKSSEFFDGTRSIYKCKGDISVLIADVEYLKTLPQDENIWLEDEFPTSSNNNYWK